MDGSIDFACAEPESRRGLTAAIDPGAEGALAVRMGTGDVRVYKCPDTYVDQLDLMRDMRSIGVVRCALEEVHAWPARMVPCPHCKRPIRQPQGSASIWAFACNYQGWLSACTASGISIRNVAPGAWMKTFGAAPKDKPERKRWLKELAQQRFPEIRVTLWNADALLLLEWAERPGTWP